jgi:hypothetical protein
MPVGEMTVTLHDVVCLWGLPVNGLPLTGVSDDDWTSLVDASFERQIDASVWVSKKNGTGDQTVYQTSRFSLKLSWLWEHFSNLPEDAMSAQIDHMRAFCDEDVWDDIIFR